MSVTIADIMAAVDVVTELVNECDTLDVEQALALHDAVGQLGSEVKRAEDAARGRRSADR
jgi:hypothetical protein